MSDKQRETIKRRQKLLYIARILSEETDENHGLTLPQIQEKLLDNGIVANRKALYYDIEALEDFGLGVETSQGRSAKYRMIQREFEFAELKMLADAVSSAKFLHEGRAKELIEKLGKFCSVYERDELRRDVFVTSRKCLAPKEGKRILYSVNNIQKAITEEKKISFKYFIYNRRKNRVQKKGIRICSPHNLVWKDEQYYLIATMHTDNSDELRNFRVDRMSDITVLDEQLKKPPKSYKVDNHVGEAFSMFDGEPVQVHLRVYSEELMNAVIDRFGMNVTIVEDDENSFTIRVNVRTSAPFYAWVFQFGKDMEIISPASVRNEYRRRIAEMYEIMK